MSSHNYLFVSDLHLSEGRDRASGKLNRNEDFFHDDAFASFLVYHVNLGERPGSAEAFRRPWRLVINGDIFDFLQVTSLPREGEELQRITGKGSYAELSENERRYGLGTSSPATVWKVQRIKEGHPLFFAALGWFLAKNPANELILLKGNHDIEIFWPAVQQAIRELVAAAYGEWQAAASAGRLPDHALPYSGDLPTELEEEDLQRRLRFPAWFHYEPDLFYVEHGNQYDPANALVNFLEPILPEDKANPDLAPEEYRVQLPSGSFFVRYFFNSVEQVHPFADNIKPITRYLRWTLTREPLATARLLINNYEKIPGVVGDLIAKDADPVHGREELQNQPTEEDPAAFGVPLDEQRWRTLYRIREMRQEEARTTSSNVAKGTAFGLALNGSTFLLLVGAARQLLRGEYGKLAGSLLGAGGAFVGGTLLSSQLDELENYVQLPEVAQRIAVALNEPGKDGKRASARYHIFGHDHLPTVEPLDDPSENRPAYPQWYVNTGCWLASFDEKNRLIRGDVQFPFLRLVPGLDGDEGPPQLLEWLPTRKGTRPLPLFGPSKDGFAPAVTDLPEITAA